MNFHEVDIVVFRGIVCKWGHIKGFVDDISEVRHANQFEYREYYLKCMTHL